MRHAALALGSIAVLISLSAGVAMAHGGDGRGSGRGSGGGGGGGYGAGSGYGPGGGYWGYAEWSSVGGDSAYHTFGGGGFGAGKIFHPGYRGGAIGAGAFDPSPTSGMRTIYLDASTATGTRGAASVSQTGQNRFRAGRNQQRH